VEQVSVQVAAPETAKALGKKKSKKNKVFSIRRPALLPDQSNRNPGQKLHRRKKRLLKSLRLLRRRRRG
jgi:hypothetical protein